MPTPQKRGVHLLGSVHLLGLHGLSLSLCLSRHTNFWILSNFLLINKEGFTRTDLHVVHCNHILNYSGNNELCIASKSHTGPLTLDANDSVVTMHSWDVIK